MKKPSFLVIVIVLAAAGISSAQSPLVQPEDFEYLGAFRLPEGDARSNTFEYGGNAMTYNPDGDSLFITGHDRMPYGEMPDGSRVAEISIPAPVIAGDVNQLNRADFLQPLSDVAAGFFTGLDEIPRVGLQYLNTPQTGPLLHIAWGQHFQPDPPRALTRMVLA